MSHPLPGKTYPCLVVNFINTLTYYFLRPRLFMWHGDARCFHVPRISPFPIHLSPAEAVVLSRRAAKYTLPYFQVQRAKMILLAAEGLSNDQIAARLSSRREVVSMWRKRFFAERLAGLDERVRPGRPRTFPP